MECNPNLGVIVCMIVCITIIQRRVLSIISISTYMDDTAIIIANSPEHYSGMIRQLRQVSLSDSLEGNQGSDLEDDIESFGDYLEEDSFLEELRQSIDILGHEVEEDQIHSGW